MAKRKRMKETQRCELELPIEIIQHIQSFLDGKEAAKSGLLSKSWYNAWFTRPVLDFSNLGVIDSKGDEEFAEMGNYIRKTTNRYKKHNLKLEKLVFQIPSAGDGRCKTIMNTLIKAASTLNVTEFGFFCHYHYIPVLPRVFKIRSLTKLSVSGYSRIHQLDNGRVLCSRLVSLHLCGLKVHEDAIKDILLACPLIENLDLSNLSKLSAPDELTLPNDRVLCPHLSSLRLHRFDFYAFKFNVIIRDILSGSPLIDYLEIHGESVHCRVMPAYVFTLKSITRLLFRDCEIEINDGRPHYSNIVFLHLHGVRIEDDAIQYIFSACPLMENLEIDQCYVMSNINVSNLHNLVSLRIKGRSDRTFHEVSFESISLTEFHKLLSVSLEYVIVGNDFFTKISSRFPHIEDLKVDHCNGYNESIQISSHSLKYLKLNDRNKLQKVEFDVPNIRKFVFETHGDYIPSLSFRTASREWDSEVTFSCSLTFIESSWFVILKDFLQELRLSRISLRFLLEDGTLAYVNDFPCAPTPVVENITINKVCVSDAFLCALFRCCRPTFITLWDCLDSHTYSCAKILYEIYMINKKFTNKVNCFNMIQSLLIYALEEIDVLLGDETVPLGKFVEGSPVFRQIPVCFRIKWGSLAVSS